MTPKFHPTGLLWKTGMPDEPGDWLWIRLWGCGCSCVQGVGYVLAWWAEDYDIGDNPGVYRVDVGGRELIVQDSRVFSVRDPDDPEKLKQVVEASRYRLPEDENGMPDWDWVARLSVPPG